MENKALPKILDLTPGHRGIWFDKDNPLVSWGDGNGPFDLVVLDPSHVNTGASSNMAKDFGYHTTKEIKDFISCSAKTAHEKTKPNAFMAFKWNDHDIKLPTVLILFKPWWEPLFGQKTATRTARGNSTYWVMLRRIGY